jgi:hypothetical protein
MTCKKCPFCGTMTRCPSCVDYVCQYCGADLDKEGRAIEPLPVTPELKKSWPEDC